MGLGDVSREAILQAVAEYDRKGEIAFLSEYGFRGATGYWLTHEGRRYPSKAIAGVAHLIATGEPSSFSGGRAAAAGKLRSLGFVVEGPARNPAWSKDELILAFDLYLANPANPAGKGSTAVADLSQLLNKMHRLQGYEGNDTLRNPNGIYLKMMNFRSADPAFISQGKVGMTRGNAFEATLWAEYGQRRHELALEARNIRDAVAYADDVSVATLPTSDLYEGEEGGVVIRLHKRYERDPRLVMEKRASAKAAGKLACEVCGFDYAAAYGDLGTDYIEVHHIKPVHAMRPGMKTRLDDLALLCANCHRMAHRRRHPLSLEEIRASMPSQSFST